MLKAILLFCTFVIAFALAEPKSKCSSELQEIVYEPETYAKQYLSKVAAAFNKGRNLLFTPQAESYIAAFQQKWSVSITVADPASICPTNPLCFTTTATFEQLQTSPYLLPFPFPYNVSSVTVSFSGSSLEGSSSLGRFSLVSPAETIIPLSEMAICLGSSAVGPFAFGFADGGAAALNCPAEQDSGVLLAPFDPLSGLNGENAQGTWRLAVGTLSRPGILMAELKICDTTLIGSCSRDALRALLNVPGFRIDAGIVYYTEDVFDSF